MLLSLAAHSALAQRVPPETLGDLTLEQLVAVQLVSAPSRRPQSAKEAPAVVTIVSADEIRRQGYRTLGDVLRTLPGFYVTYDRTSSYLGVRGFGPPGDYNTRILFLLNGVRTNDKGSFGTYEGEATYGRRLASGIPTPERDGRNVRLQVSRRF